MRNIVIAVSLFLAACGEVNTPKTEENNFEPLLVQSDPVTVDHFMVSLSNQFRVVTNGEIEFKCGTGGMYSTFTKYGNINSKVFFSSRIEAIRRLEIGEEIGCEKAKRAVDSQPKEHASHDKLDSIQRAELIPRYYKKLQDVLHSQVCYGVAERLSNESPSAVKYADYWRQVHQTKSVNSIEAYIGIREDGITAWQASDLEEMLLEKHFGTDLALVERSKRDDLRTKYLLDNCAIN